MNREELLEEYTRFLYKNGYVDDDVWCEKPTAIERFLNDFPFSSFSSNTPSKRIKYMKIKTLYLMSHKMKWKTFKMLNEKLVNKSGPVPMGAEKILWQMLRDKQIYCWFCNEMKNDMGVGLELPEYEELEIIA